MHSRCRRCGIFPLSLLDGCEFHVQNFTTQKPAQKFPPSYRGRQFRGRRVGIGDVGVQTQVLKA